MTKGKSRSGFAAAHSNGEGPHCWKPQAQTGLHRSDEPLKGLKWLWLGKEAGIIRTEASQGPADGISGILQHGFFKRQSYPAWLGTFLFIQEQWMYHQGLENSFLFLSSVPFCSLGTLKSLCNIIATMLSLLKPKGTNLEMHSVPGK